jgi:integrase/recombinase XerD
MESARADSKMDNTGIIEGFLNQKRVNGQSENTIIHQQRVIRELSKFLSKPFKEATSDDINQFILHKGETCSKRTTNILKVVVKNFYSYLYELERGSYPSQVAHLRSANLNTLPITPRDVLNKDDVFTLINYCQQSRDKALVCTLYESGCRVGELKNMDVDDLHFTDLGVELHVSGKTGTRRILLLESKPYLLNWLEDRPPFEERVKKHGKEITRHPLWSTLILPYKRLKSSSIQSFLTQLGRQTGLKKKTNAHNFRHSRCTYLSKFMSDAQMRQYFGWKRGSLMVGIYSHLTGADTDQAVMESAGIPVEREQFKKSPLSVKRCPSCETENAATQEFCVKCRRPFDEVLIQKTMEREDRFKILEEHYEKTKGVGDYLNNCR